MLAIDGRRKTEQNIISACWRLMGQSHLSLFHWMLISMQTNKPAQFLAQTN
jgi:hypothetical protein